MPKFLRAVAWMSGTLLSFLLMAIAGRELSDTMETLEILFFRGIVAFTIMLGVMSSAGWHHAKTRQPALQVARNLVHLGGQYGWFFGLGALPLADVFAIEFTAPIWSALLAMLIFSERLDRGRLVAIVFGFAGVLIILRPGAGVISPAAFIVLASAFCFASTYMMTKGLIRTDSSLSVLFYMSAVQLPFSLSLALFFWVAPTWADLPWIIAVGATSLTAHYCLTHAFRLADAILVLPVDFLRLPLIIVIGAVFYAEPFAATTLIGAAVIFAGNYYSIFRESRLPR